MCHVTQEQYRHPLHGHVTWSFRSVYLNFYSTVPAEIWCLYSDNDCDGYLTQSLHLDANSSWKIVKTWPKRMIRLLPQPLGPNSFWQYLLDDGILLYTAFNDWRLARHPSLLHCLVVSSLWSIHCYRTSPIVNKSGQSFKVQSREESPLQVLKGYDHDVVPVRDFKLESAVFLRELFLWTNCEQMEAQLFPRS